MPWKLQSEAGNFFHFSQCPKNRGLLHIVSGSQKSHYFREKVRPSRGNPFSDRCQVPRPSQTQLGKIPKTPLEGHAEYPPTPMENALGSLEGSPRHWKFLDLCFLKMIYFPFTCHMKFEPKLITS